jgi:ribosomal protein S18 acetylase RimI-like enzyme
MVEIRSPKRSELAEIVNILLIAFEDKFSYIFRGEIDKGKELFNVDYSSMDDRKLTNYFVAIENNRVVGTIHLKSRSSNYKQLSFIKIIKKMGFFKGLRVGIALRLLDSFEFEKNSCYIASLAVLPEYRNLGTGAALLSNAENYSKKKNYKSLSLHVLSRNVNARIFYKKFGFKEIQRINSFWTQWLLGFREYIYLKKIV